MNPMYHVQSQKLSTFCQPWEAFNGVICLIAASC